MRARWLGRVAHGPAWALMERLRGRVLAGDAAAETLLLLEHDPVVTLGRSARRADVLLSDDLLARRGIALARAGRGGGVTYHGPGQLVGYPVLRLRRGVVAHVEAIGAALAAVATDLGIGGARFRRDAPGLWVGDAKLASIGVGIHRRVAAHGFALNVSCDALDGFGAIVPCATPGLALTSVESLTASAPPLRAVAALAARALADALGRAPGELHDDPAPVESSQP